MSFFFLKAAALPSGLLLLSSPSLLWITANVIFICLLSSYRQHRTAFSDSHDDDVSAAVDRLYPSEEHDLLFPAMVVPDDAVVEKRQTPEARTAPRRPANRPRVRTKPAGEESPRALAAEAMVEVKKPAGEESLRAVSAVLAAEAMPEVKKAAVEKSLRAVPAVLATEAMAEVKKPVGEESLRAVPAVLAARSMAEVKKAVVEERPRAVAADEANPGGSDDLSMDSAWQSIVRSGVARPVVVRKSETWGGEDLPRMQRAAKKAVARREIRKSATMVPASPPHPSAAAPVAAKQGWRTRDVLVMAQGELLSRAESFIRRQHEYLRLQRQESEQRQAMELERRRCPAFIRF